MTAEDLTLPGTPGPTLQAVTQALTPPQRAAFYGHLFGGTSADWLAGLLREFGYQISATTIRTYRRSLEGGVQR